MSRERGDTSLPYEELNRLAGDLLLYANERLSQNSSFRDALAGVFLNSPQELAIGASYHLEFVFGEYNYSFYKLRPELEERISILRTKTDAEGNRHVEEITINPLKSLLGNKDVSPAIRYIFDGVVEGRKTHVGFTNSQDAVDSIRNFLDLL